MARYVSANTGVALPNEPHLILQRWLRDNWLTAADPNYPNIPMKDQIGWGYLWIDQQRANKNVTLQTRHEPEIPYNYYGPMMNDYNPRIWLDIYVRVLDTEFDNGIPQFPPRRLTSMNNYIKDKVDSNYLELNSQGIHSIQHDGFDLIQNDEANVFHGIIYVRTLYRLVGVP